MQNPTTTPSLRISNEPGERTEKKKMPFIVATYVYASSQGQRTHSARTKILTNYALYNSTTSFSNFFVVQLPLFINKESFTFKD